MNANAVEVSPGNHTLDPNKAFVMTSLNGVVLNETTIEFTGKDTYDSDIHLTATLDDSSLHLTANTIPPQGSADYFIYTMDAVAERKYSGGTGEPNNPYEIAEPNDWVELTDNPADWDKCFILTANNPLESVSNLQNTCKQKTKNGRN